MVLSLAGETAKAILETKPNNIGFLTIRADGLIALVLEWTNAREDLIDAATDACREVEGELGAKHALSCDSVTEVVDECNCHLSLFRKAIASIGEERDD